MSEPLPEFAAGHFYSPIPNVTEVYAEADKLFSARPPPSDGIDPRRQQQLALLNELAKFYPEFDWPEKAEPERRFNFDQMFFLHGDAVALYSMLRHLRPKRVIEVGSGHSSALMLDVRDRFLDPQTRFIFIEPYPDRLKKTLTDADYSTCTIIEDRVQNIPVGHFSMLEAGDILFIDSSHVSKIASDVNYLIFGVLPSLAPGVVIHIHDIFWPFEYLPEWIKGGRFWNEAYLIRAFLQFNSEFKILLFNNYVKHSLGEQIARQMPLLVQGEPGSLWIYRTRR